MQDEPSAKSFLTPALYEPRMTLRPIARLSLNEIGRERVVGKNSANMTGGENYRIGLHLFKPALGGGLLGQIEHLAAYRQNIAPFAGKPPDSRRAGHTVVAAT